MAVADALVSKVLDMLISGIFSEAEQKFKLVVGTKKDVKMLTDNLQSIQAVLFDADKRQLKEETVNLWLQRLKNVSYDIDDVLDEWSTEILKSKIEGDEYEYALKHKRAKVWSFVLSSCFCFHEVGFRHDIAVRIKELNGRLEDIARQKDTYMSRALLKGTAEIVQRPMTSSVVNVSEVRRRKDDENTILNLLLAQSKTNPHVISVAGMGGIGKTTLAKLVYNEGRVQSHFDIRIWVCVSDPFDEIRIAKAILKSLKGSAPDHVEWQNIVDEIQQCIERKKFLLVLDDVWNEDANKWEQVEHFLKCGSLGSKILVTTRNQNVAKVMGCRDIIQLGLLPEEECWSMFSQIVSSESSSIELNSPLVEIGRKIIARCMGLPLAVKTMGGHLRFKDSIEDWESVLNSELWELEGVQRGVLAPLWLSYNDLSSPLKQCFLHCVIFPKDHDMSKRKLIGMWMSQGYLRATRGKDIHVIGEEYFQHLAMRSLFQDFEKDFLDKNNSYCKMHDLVHDFGKSLMKKESCSVEVNSTTNRIEDLREDLSYNQIRHLVISMVGQREDSFPSCVYNFKTLRSLMILSNPNFSSMIEAALPCIFHELTCLRSLSLRGCDIEKIPSNISKLIHLRELDLSWNSNLKKLPDTICNLYNLQTLVVDKCQNLESLPQGMGKLINLNCLYNLGISLLLPKGIGRLSHLRRLSWLNIGHDKEREEAYLSLRDVESLNNLGGYLCIKWRRQHKANVDLKEAKQAQLKAKKRLTELDIFFSAEDEDGGEWRKKGGDEELLEALEPPPNLKCLEILYYQGIKICNTSWITLKLNYLRKLFLWDWRNCEQLPGLGNLPSLEDLTLSKFKSAKKVGGEFLGIDGHHRGIGGSGASAADAMNTALILFPKLIKLKFSWMEEWKEWNYEDETIKNIIIMPYLRSLTLDRCWKLKELPSYITQISSLKFEIDFCPALDYEGI